MSKDLQIGFELLEITRRSFNLVAGVDLVATDYELVVQLGFGASPDARRVQAVPQISFRTGETTFLTLDLIVTFGITEEAWQEMTNEDGNLRLPLGFARHLGVIGLGTARGFLAAKLEGDPDYGKLVLPTVDLTSTVMEDIVISFGEEE